MIGEAGGARARVVVPPAGMVAPPADARLDGLTADLRAAGGGTVGAILLYGSHVQASEPDRFSAYDLIVVVDRYRPFYEALAAAGLLRRPPWLMAAWSHVLPPTSISFDPGRPDEAVGKCQAVSAAHFRSTLGPHAKDHFLKGRTAQRLALVWTRDDVTADVVLDTLRAAREETVHWVRPYLRGPFTAEAFAETMLRVSYAAEIRPETGERVREVYRAQRGTLEAIAREAIDAGLARGDIEAGGDAFAWSRPPGNRARLAASAYFTRSKVRATARWMKHIVTFEDWPLYIMRKLERRAGLQVQVTERERRWPFIFLWPKLFRVLGALRRIRRPPNPTGGISSA